MTTPTKRVTPCPTPFSDHIYKVAEGGVEVPLRVWPALESSTVSSAAAGGKPWLLWFHGGGFSAGKHSIPNAWVIGAFRSRGYHIVSAAYRFTPHVGLEEIITSDAADALAWCRSHLPSLLSPDTIDLDAYVVAGDSAGGTIATLCGHHLSPAPRVVIDVFGIVDMTDPWFHPRGPGKDKLEDSGFLSGEFPLEELEAESKARNAAEAQTIIAYEWEMPPAMSVQDLQSFWGMEYTPGAKDRRRMQLQGFMHQRGILFHTLLRRERFASDEAWQKELIKWSAYYLLDTVETFPPTFVLHGDKDTAVPVQQSHMLVEKLKAKGVPVGAAYDPEGEHCFDNKIEVPSDEGWNEYVVPCMDFVDKHINGH